MCGLAGTINWCDDETLASMIAVQAHRGPDNSDTWSTKSKEGLRVGLASCRLSILDLSSSGHMPMTTEDGAVTAVYNGEVYNFPELREELQQEGYTFKSNCDTEVVLNMYHRYGVDCVKHLNGMFALAIWDDEKQHLFVARDHFGIKPLYYTQLEGKFAFASEIKSFLSLPGFKREIDYSALDQYLSFLWVPDPMTMLKNVYKLEAGHYGLLTSDGKFDVKCYWDLEFPINDDIPKADPQELAGEIQSRFSSVVKSQMVSDVPLGAFLSAGLDSSSILACMAQHTSASINTYTITFPAKYRKGENAMDDPKVAERTAQHFGCNHHEIEVEPDVSKLLPELIWHMDEPICDPALIMAYLVSEAASKDVKVMLSGVGGDELFGGYRKYQAQRIAENYRKLPSFLRKRVIEPLVDALPSMRGTPVKGQVRLAKKLASTASLGPKDFFIANSVYITEQQKSKLLTKDTINATVGCNYAQRHLERFDKVEHADMLSQMLYLDTKIFMPSLNLTYNDKMSMASSVEARVPFLDWQFAQWVANNVPSELKIFKNSTKHILREAMKPWLPSEVLTQRKSGFSAPIDYWLANELKDFVDEHLSEAQVRYRGIFEPKEVQRYISEQRSGRRDWSMQIWQFLTLELWMKAYID